MDSYSLQPTSPVRTLFLRPYMIDSSKMEEDRNKMAESVLNLTLEILFQLTGEDYTVVKKTSSDGCQAPVCDGWRRPNSPITGPPLDPLINEDSNIQKILELTNKMVELLTGEVPLRCQDVTVYFSMEEWEYVGGHRDLYKDVMMEDHRPLTSLGPHMIDSSKMEKGKNKMAESVLHLTLEILFQLTGEDYTVVKKTSSDGCRAPVCDGWGRPLSTFIGPPPHRLIHENINVQKILELTKKMTELLTGEVPIRCQDVTVYFSMEEWEYVGGHRDLYKDVMMEDHRPLTSPVPSSKRRPPERCPRPLPPQDHQLLCPDEDLPNINATERDVRGDQRCKEEIPAGGSAGVEPPQRCSSHPYSQGRPEGDVLENEQGENLIVIKVEVKEEAEEPDIRADQQYGLMERNPPEKCPRRLYSLDYPEEKPSVPENQQLLYPDEDLPNINTTERDVRGDQRRKEEIPADNCTRSSEGYLISSKDGGISLDTYEEQVMIPDLPSTLHSTDLPSDPLLQRMSSDSSQPDKQEKSHRKDVQYQSTHTGEKPYSCSVCAKSFPHKPQLVRHERRHREKPYSCSKCGKCFTQKSELVRHERVHTGEKPYSCAECGKCFTQKSYLGIHERIHTGEKPYSCSECGKCFTQKSDLVRHERVHTGQKPYSCSVCGKCFPYKSKLATHERSHTGEKPYSCAECGKGFPYKSQLFIHERSHTGEKPYSCIQCGKCFSQKSQLVRHERSHTEKPYSCSECGKCFTGKSTLGIHKKIHTGEKPYSCSECGKCFTGKSTLGIHKKIHTGEKPYSCSECGKCFTGKSTLVIHQRSHTGEKPYSCSECGKCFTQQAHLVTHERVHTGEKPYSCSECGKCFQVKSNLVLHKKIHTGEKPYSCSECGKCFTERAQLVRHERVHTGEKPYSCSECGKCFQVKSNLVLHKKIHTGEKLYSCSECGKCFTQKSHLVLHERTHTGEKPYSCSECGKCFTGKSTLGIHKKIHTGEKPYSCSECGKGFTQKSYLVLHKKIHTGEKPYSCSECGRGFIMKSHLVVHERIHTGEKPYSCPECGKCFTHKSQLVIHERIHTGEKPFACSECDKCFIHKPFLIAHERSHTGQKPYSCSQCGKYFSNKSNLHRHERSHIGSVY
ncbi:zinc finger protein 420-like isoform X2 [Eleutherodactylus coqui]|uniref:zinc finger protein 420-like isoform X2 n=1 Tax=Eleutherodactylus coqui TaxID=57060 RepID=UPI0034626FA7